LSDVIFSLTELTSFKYKATGRDSDKLIECRMNDSSDFPLSHTHICCLEQFQDIAFWI
jgi:hypothetical protein